MGRRRANLAALPAEIPSGQYRSYLGALIRQLSSWADTLTQELIQGYGATYGHGHLTLSGNVAIGALPYTILWNFTAVDASGVSYDPVTGIITLDPGAIYLVQHQPSFEFSGPTGNGVSRFWDVDASAYVGRQSNIYVSSHAGELRICTGLFVPRQDLS